MLRWRLGKTSTSKTYTHRVGRKRKGKGQECSKGDLAKHPPTKHALSLPTQISQLHLREHRISSHPSLTTHHSPAGSSRRARKGRSKSHRAPSVIVTGQYATAATEIFIQSRGCIYFAEWGSNSSSRLSSVSSRGPARKL